MASQLSDGTIYFIGGIYANRVFDDGSFATTTLKLDPNLSISFKAPMQASRWLHSTQVVKDRYIIVMGGNQLRSYRPYQHMTEVECYDTATDQWLTIDSLPQTCGKYVASTVINSRIVFAMPDLKDDYKEFFRLDVGSEAEYHSTMNSGLSVIARKRWTPFTIYSPVLCSLISGI